MGYIQFESVEHANKVADLLGFERPYSAIIGEDNDPTLTRFKDMLAMSKSVADLKGETMTSRELIEQALGKNNK